MSREAMKLALEEMKVGNYNSAAERLETALAEQPAPVQGWKLVPVEPTEDMWKAVNKLDDEMAAGSYDGKGCSIEQAWNCLLAAAPQPAQQEPFGYGRIWGDARMFVPTLPSVRDGSWLPLYTSPPAQRTWVGLTPEELDEMFSKTLKGKKLVNWVAQAIESKLKEKNNG